MTTVRAYNGGMTGTIDGDKVQVSLSLKTWAGLLAFAITASALATGHYFGIKGELEATRTGMASELTAVRVEVRGIHEAVEEIGINAERLRKLEMWAASKGWEPGD